MMSRSKSKQSYLARLWERQGGRCFYCDGPAELGLGPNDPRAATRDHVFKSSERESYPEDIRYISVMACRLCNAERGHLPAHEYIMVHAGRLETCIEQPSFARVNVRMAL